jgi:hypothetical protein
MIWPLRVTMVDKDLIAESKQLALWTSVEIEMAQERQYISKMHRFFGGLRRADLGDGMAFRGYNGGPGFDC